MVDFLRTKKYNHIEVRYVGMIFGIIIGLFLLLANLIFAMRMEQIAVQKGYENSHAFALVFFFGIMGCLYVAALPDRKAAQQREDILTVLLSMSQEEEK